MAYVKTGMVIHLLFTLIRRHASSYLAGTILLGASVFVQALAPRVLGQAIDALGAETVDAAFIGTCALRMLAIAGGSFILRFIWRYLVIGGSRHMERELRTQLFKKYQSFPVSFYHTSRSGDLMAYAVNDIGAVRMAFGPGFAHLLTGVSTAVISLFSMGQMVSVKLTLLAFLPIPLAIYSILRIGDVVRRRFRKVQQQFASLSGFVAESITGMRVIKTFVQEEAQGALFDEESEKMMNLGVNLARASAAMSPVSQGLFGVCFAISIGYGGSLVQSGAITLGAFATFNAYLLMIMQPVVAMGRIVNILQRGFASLKRLEELFDAPSIAPFELTEDDTVSASEITARHLSFRYPGAAVDALTDVSFTLRKGGTLGVVGLTGSGKSTLLSLIMKFYDAPEGALYIGERDIHAVSAASLRRKAGYVPQEGFLFSGTIAENIAFYTEGVGLGDVLRAAEQAGLSEDLSQLQGGLSTQVGERGGHLSGGQRQRTALARALIRQPELLLLDDTLSAVDNETQRRMIATLAEYQMHCSTIIVSHKLSAVAHADEILYLDGGRVLERGTHAQLIEKGGQYAAIWESQRTEGEEAV